MADLNSTIIRGKLRVTDDIYAGSNISAVSISENNVSLVDKYLGKTAKAADSDKLDGQDSTYYLNYNNLSNKPTIPATNVIPATTTANKVLVSTTTSRTAKWSDWSSAGFLKTNSSGVISVDTNTYLTTSGTAANSSKLNNQEASYYLNYNNFTNKPTLGTAAAKNSTTSVTQNSNDLVTSGAVYTAIENAIITALNTPV